mmetsp:Transcript_61160/g.134481  ORF Transcript_61160/g.134481 Transcript_61160/m.134481 type:complete len:228 (+) Transcript_61160:15-698(+)
MAGTAVPQPTDALEDALQGFAGVFKQDPKALELLELTEKAVELLRLGQDSRKAAVGALIQLRDKLHTCRRMGSYVKEAGMLEKIAGRAQMDEGYGARSMVGMVQDPEDNPAMKDALQQMMQQVSAETKDYEFINDCEATEMTVNIPVPPDTKMKDLVVKLTKTTIRVEVKGHETQPCVIDGSFFRAVETAGCDHHLEGSGEKRMLVLDLEKQQGGYKWPELLGFAGP